MDRETAIELRDSLTAVSDVRTANVVHFEDIGGTHYASLDTTDSPNDGLYGVEFYAHDALIPHDVIVAISEFETGGIYTRPDIIVVCPAPE